MQQQLLAAFMLLASVDFSAFARHTLPNTNNSRIIDGSDVPPGEYVPYQVSVQLYMLHHCGGSIISPSHVLTAGHCCHGRNVKQMSVLAGVLQLYESGPMRVPVKSCDKHEKYSKIKIGPKATISIYDIAILRLKRDLPLDGVRFATIAFTGSEDVGGDVPVTLTGWGDFDKYGTTSNTLQRLNYHTITHEDCKTIYRHLLETQLCAIGPQGSACSGDSGGPLVMSTPEGLRQVGILSSGFGCPNYPHGEPDVYTRLSKFDAWIQKHMK